MSSSSDRLKKFLENLAHLAFGFTLALTFIWLMDVNRERRFVIYHIIGELKKDMPKAEAEDVIHRHQATFINRSDSEGRTFLLVHMGLTDALYLSIDYADGKLVSARLGGEDNPQDVPKDAPANIE